MSSKFLRPSLSPCHLAFVGAILAMFQIGAQTQAAAPRSLAVSGDITGVHTLSQNWSDAEAIRFYNVPQGSQLISLDWFLHLEQAERRRAKGADRVPQVAVAANPAITQLAL